MSVDAPTAGAPALYRTTIMHQRLAPVRHRFEMRSYCWYIDIDNPPQLPRWLRPFARFDPRDHFDGPAGDSLRDRVDCFLTRQGVVPPGGAVTALLQARVLGYVFNPLTMYWCHDSEGNLRHIIAEVHNTFGGRRAYLLPDRERIAQPVQKTFYVSPFNDVDGHYRIRAPRPGDRLSVTVTLHRDGQPPFTATMTGQRKPGTARQLAWFQVIAPLSTLRVAVGIRTQGMLLSLRRVPFVPRDKAAARLRT